MYTVRKLSIFLNENGVLLGDVTYLSILQFSRCVYIALDKVILRNISCYFTLKHILLGLKELPHQCNSNAYTHKILLRTEITVIFQIPLHRTPLPPSPLLPYAHTPYPESTVNVLKFQTLIFFHLFFFA